MNTAVKGEPGLAVDAKGNPVIDPTKNVEDLVKALRETLQEFRSGDQRYLDSQLAWAEKLGNFARNADTKMVELAASAEARLRDSLRSADKMLAEAETRRIDQLAQTRQEFQNTIRDMLAESVRTTSTLVSTQLVQIQATFDTRVSKLEAGAFTQAGKSSVQDPQTSEAMSKMANSIAMLSQTTAESMHKSAQATADAIAKLTISLTEMQTGSTVKKETKADVNTLVMAAVAIGGLVIAYLSMRGH